MPEGQPETGFGARVLLALKHSQENLYGMPSNFRMVYYGGRILFGQAWAGCEQEHNWAGDNFWPRISMELGKLKRRGLCHSTPKGQSQLPSHTVWELSAEGQALAGQLQLEELGIHAD